MTPETDIINAISDFWVEKFPISSTDTFPKGLVKRISMEAVKAKGGIVTGQYNTRINLLWYDRNTISFDTKMASLISSMDALRSEVKIKSVVFEGRDDGYDDSTDNHVMNLEFVFKHYL